MNRFYIKSINAYKPDGTVSSLEFKKDINVICGPTNTGKTYVFEAISFMMGGSKFKDGGDNFGYNVFELILTNDTDNISIKRNINLQKYDVNSSFDLIKSGTYYSNVKSTKINRGFALFNKGVAFRQKALYLPIEKQHLIYEYLGNAIEAYTSSMKFLKNVACWGA